MIACYAIGIERSGHQLAEAVTYGSPDGTMLRLTLLGLGMRHGVWERFMPRKSSIGGMVTEYRCDSSVVAVNGSGASALDLLTQGIDLLAQFLLRLLLEPPSPSADRRPVDRLGDAVELETEGERLPLQGQRRTQRTPK